MKSLRSNIYRRRRRRRRREEEVEGGRKRRRRGGRGGRRSMGSKYKVGFLAVVNGSSSK